MYSMVKGWELANSLTPDRMSQGGSKWRGRGLLQTTVVGSGVYGCLQRIGCEEVDGLQLSVTVTVHSVEDCEIRDPLYTGKAGQLNVGSRVPGVYPVMAG